MKFSASRESLLRPIQMATGVVERRQTLPVLSNLLFVADSNGLRITGTDLEVELSVAVADVSVEQEGEATLPARKLADIWRNLPDESQITVAVEGDRAVVRSGRSRFTLATLPAADFPSLDGDTPDVALDLSAVDLHKMIDRVSFSMAQQDVRFFLNGMLLESGPEHTRVVATDGHRLAICTLPIPAGEGECHAIIPRKAVTELGRLCSDSDGAVSLQLSKKHMTSTVGEYSLTSRLLDGKFPEYERVVPKNTTAVVEADRATLRQAFQRASILSNEKYRGVRLLLNGDNLTIQANNPEQEEAEESIPVGYSGSDLEIGFNVSYLQDVLNALPSDGVRINLSDAASSALIEGSEDDGAIYVVMPMRL